ncbi:MAG: nucleotidyltransferase domain-containing protein [Clostridiales Family XIII bacterium]|jgi:predicted nucleotidyltransferase|nr:nucleotidyltransferase domain-containing protein [Clostridiales Family XIII bacterium]
MLTQNAVIEIVRNYAREIEEQGVNLRTVILFGSFAKGRQHEWSDIDVALVADDFTGIGFVDRERFQYVGIKKPYIRIESKTYPTDYFRNSDPFIEEIKKDGIVVFNSTKQGNSI